MRPLPLSDRRPQCPRVGRTTKHTRIHSESCTHRVQSNRMGNSSFQLLPDGFSWPPPPHITAMSSPTESALVKPVRLDPVTEARLSRLAEDTGRKKSFYRRQLIEQGMDDLEDAYLGALALEAHHRSGEATIPLDQVMRNLGLAH